MVGQFLNKARKLGNRLKVNQKGGILIQVALASIVLMGMLGIGVDLGRAYLYRSQLSGALDAAALAGAKSFHSQTRDAEIQAFFDSNFDAGFMGGQIGHLTITEVDAVTKTLDVAVSGQVDTVFMQLFGFKNITIAASAETTSKQTGLQIVMVLDNTGSMSSNDGGTVRIDALQTASTTLVESLFGSDASNDKLQVAIVPYVTSVNVGHLLDPAYVDITGMPNSYDLSTTDKSKWYGCVEARNTNADLSAASSYDVKVEHEGADWVPFLWKPHYDKKLYSLDDLQGPNGEVWPAPDYEYHGELGTSSYDAGPNLNCPAPVLDFTTTKADLTTYIDQKLRYSYGRGGTIANLGMVWGWRMLHTGSPFFNDIAYDDDKMVKAAVLMTDGYNWIISDGGKHPYYDGRNRYNDNSDDYDDDGDGNCPRCNGQYDYDDEMNGPNAHGYYDGDYSGYGRRDEGRLDGAITNSTTQDKINDRLAYVCSAMKGMGITIYTITFGYDIAGSGSNAIELRNLYEGCATDSGKYFHAPTASQLDGAFEAIANDLADLRLSK